MAGGGPDIAKGSNVVDEKDSLYFSGQRNQTKKRISFLQRLLSTPGCVLLIDNLETDAEPVNVLGQLTKFCDAEKVHSVHIPPPYPERGRSIGYVVFTDKESSDLTAAFLSRNFVVSARGRPWIATRCNQQLNEENFGFPTISAFKGEAEDDGNDPFGGLKIVTEKQEIEYNKAERRWKVFDQHNRQCRIMFQRHSKEDKELDGNPDLNLS